MSVDFCQYNEESHFEFDHELEDAIEADASRGFKTGETIDTYLPKGEYENGDDDEEEEEEEEEEEAEIELGDEDTDEAKEEEGKYSSISNFYSNTMLLILFIFFL
jgi:hypothetical protein